MVYNNIIRGVKENLTKGMVNMKNVKILVKGAQEGQNQEVSNVFVEVDGNLVDRYITRSPYRMVALLVEDYEGDNVEVLGL